MKTSWRATIWRRIGVLKKIKSYCCQRHCLTFTQIKSRHIRNDKNRDCRSPQMRIYSWALLSKRTKAHSDSQCQKTIVAMVYSKNCKGFPACNCHVKKMFCLSVLSSRQYFVTTWIIATASWQSALDIEIDLWKLWHVWMRTTWGITHNSPPS